MTHTPAEMRDGKIRVFSFLLQANDDVGFRVGQIVVEDAASDDEALGRAIREMEAKLPSHHVAQHLRATISPAKEG